MGCTIAAGSDGGSGNRYRKTARTHPPKSSAAVMNPIRKPTIREPASMVEAITTVDAVLDAPAMASLPGGLRLQPTPLDVPFVDVAGLPQGRRMQRLRQLLER